MFLPRFNRCCTVHCVILLALGIALHHRGLAYGPEQGCGYAPILPAFCGGLQPLDGGFGCLCHVSFSLLCFTVFCCGMWFNSYHSKLTTGLARYLGCSRLACVALLRRVSFCASYPFIVWDCLMDFRRLFSFHSPAGGCVLCFTVLIIPHRQPFVKGFCENSLKNSTKNCTNFQANTCETCTKTGKTNASATNPTCKTAARHRIVLHFNAPGRARTFLVLHFNIKSTKCFIFTNEYKNIVLSGENMANT